MSAAGSRWGGRRFWRVDLPAAVQAFERARELDRTFAECHGAIAMAHARAGRTAQARASAELALRLDRDCLSARFAEELLAGRGAAPDVARLARRLLGGRAGPLGGHMADWLPPAADA